MGLAGSYPGEGSSAGRPARVTVSPTRQSVTSFMLAITAPTSPARSSSTGTRLGRKTASSLTSKVFPDCMRRISSPRRRTPSFTRM